VRGLDPQDLAYGREMGYALKLLATGRRTDGKIEARVHPPSSPPSIPWRVSTGRATQSTWSAT